MRCPKCHYISFESADRCRNCGYEFSLASASPQEDPELPLNNRNEDPLPPVDLRLGSAEESPEVETPGAIRFDADGTGRTSSPDLPLFKAGGGSRRPTNLQPDDDDAPLVRPSAVPRAPIAVRRATPDVHRMRSRYSVAEVPKLDLESADEIEQFAAESEDRLPPSAAAPVPAPPVRRVLAGIIDLLIVSGINMGVLYFTARLCDLPLSVAGVLEIPPVPLIGFLLLLDGGYFVAFTSVVGQTIGKMATGLRVVHVSEAGDGDTQPNFGFATLRTAAYGASILPVGLGFLPALIGKDRRALHDRLAETRVIFSGKLMV
jgi:uncharacterized RDD family membrane protein YckC